MLPSQALISLLICWIMLLFFILLYLAINIGIGIWASRRVHNAEDFAVAGRRLPLAWAASALFATWFGSETVMGASARFVQFGVLGVIEDPLGSSLCLALVGAFFARPLYRMHLLTFNDYFRQRYGRSVELVSAVFMVPSYFGWIAGQLVALAIITETLVGLPFVWGVLLCAGVVVIYTYIGGMWAVSLTDFIQTIMILIGLVILMVSLVISLGGFVPFFTQVPQGFYDFLPPMQPLPIAQYLTAWITVGLGSIPQQDIFQRTMAAKSERVAVQAAYLSAAMYLTVAVLPLFIALAGKLLYPALVQALLAQGKGEYLIVQMVWQHYGLGLQIAFFGALLSAILSTTSGAMLAPAVVLAENIVKPLRRQALTDAQLLALMRWSVVGVAICAVLMAVSKASIYELVRQSSSLSLVGLFCPLVFGMYWRRANATGAVSAILAGMAVWLWGEWAGWAFPPTLAGLLASLSGMLLGSWSTKSNV